MNEQLSEAEERLLFHALGYSYEPRWNEGRREERNWIGIPPSEDDPYYLTVKALVQKGYMTQGQNTPWGEEVYFATPVAEDYVVNLWEKKKKKNKPSRSKRRYDAYSEWCDYYWQAPFRVYLEWLQLKEDNLDWPEGEYERVKYFKSKWEI